MGHSKIKIVALAAATTLGLFTTLPGSVSGGGIGIEINLGVPTPPRHAEVVVLDYDSYCVGYRHNLYDADWRLRNAQIEQFNAQESLEVSRRHEGEIAVTVEDQEAFVTGFARKVAESDAALAAAREAAGHAVDDAADARARLHAFEKRIAGAKDDFEAARTLHDGPAIEDAEKRIRTNEAAAAVAATELRVAEGRAADLHAAEAAAAALNDSRLRLAEANEHLPALRIEMTTAHDGVFAAEQRLDAAVQGVALALHDRDEALWMLHRDEILSGRATLASCGFTVDLNTWGGHMPRDPEVVHAYFVHPVTYWVERPVEIQTRMVEVDHVVEIGRVRQIQEKHEGPRFHEVVKFETAYPVERRREFAQRVVVERTRLVSEREERTHAAAEHRAPRIPESERAEARAIVTKAHAEAKASDINAHAEARAEVTKAHADAKSERIADKAEVNKAHADAKSERIGDKAEVNKAKADSKAEQVAAHGDAKAAKTEARAEENQARGDAKTKEIEARSDAKAKETEAKADAKAKQTEAKADVKAKQTEAKNTKNGNKPNSEPTASASQKNKDPRNKPRDGQASVDQSR